MYHKTAAALGLYTPGGKVDKKFRNRLELVEYGKYKIILNLLAEYYDETVKQSCFSMFERFAVIDELLLDEAYITLDKVYPKKSSTR